LKYDIVITDTCLGLLQKIRDKRIQRTILDRIQKLSEEPEKQGKKLVKDLSGFRSLHVGGRYRVIYEVQKQVVTVYVLAAGIRKQGDKKDIYEIAKKLLKAGLLDLEDDKA
jgi:mRNA interferase RelE/StbE